MQLALTLLVGLLLGAGGVWWLLTPPHRKEVQYLRDELATAQDRLLGAWKEGAVIPTREQVAPVQPTEVEPLPMEFLKLATDYESAEGQSAAETFIRQKRAQGWSLERIKQALDAEPGT